MSSLYESPNERLLHIFGVRCNNMATDDVFFPTMVAFAFKATWLYVTLGVAIYLFLHPGCTALSLPLLLSTSIVGFLVIQLAGLINDIIVIIVSSRGSLSNFEPRRKVKIFVYIGCFIFFTQVSWNIFSTYAAFSQEAIDEELTNCTSYATAVKMYDGVILSHWGCLFFMIPMYVLWMDPLGCYRLQSKIQEYHESISAEVDTDGNSQGVHSNTASCFIWLNECFKLKRGVSVARKQALGDVVSTFKVLFEDWDYTFYDVRSGLKLMSLFHEKMRKNKKDPAGLIIQKTIEVLKTDENYEAPGNPIVLEHTSSELRRHVTDLKYYLDYAMASYGWPIHVYLNPFRGPISLCVSSRCNCCCAKCQEQTFEGNVCFPNEAAIKAMTGVEDGDIVTASFVNAVHIVPFYVVKVEREGRKQVIIAIRGTLSVKDALTDASASMYEVKDDLLGVHPSYVHRGFYEAAQGIYKHLMEESQFQDLVMKQNYEVVLTGHSLGAAVSSVLAVLLKHHHPEWTENLKAFNFATPAVFNYLLAKKTDEFIISVVSGYDVVPRMTVRGLGHLILSVADFIQNSKHSKQSIICCSGRCGWEPEIDIDAIEQRHAASLQELKLPPTDSDSDDDADGDSMTDVSALASVGAGGPRGSSKKKPMIGRRLLKALSVFAAKERKEVCALSVEEREPMLFTPGRILHLEVEETDQMKSFCSCSLKHASEVKASWKAREELSGIQLHDSMFLDHGPTRTIDFITTLHDNVEEANSKKED